MEFPRRFWVCGTDTGIGKTLISAMLVSRLKARYWKPIQTGIETESDSRSVRALAELDPADVLKEAYALKAPLSPHAAAELEDIYINPGEILFPKPDLRFLVIEAAGGLFVPLNEDTLQIDLIAESGLPVLLVSANRLGTINHTLLSLHALYQRTIPVIGVVLSGEPSNIHKEAIENFGFSPVIAQIPWLEGVNPETVRKAGETYF